MKKTRPKIILLFLLISTVGVSVLKTESVNAAGSNAQETTTKPLNTGNNLTLAHTSEISENVATINNIQSRDELLHNVSSYSELDKILIKFRNFIEMPVISANNSNGSLINKVTTLPTGSIHIYYSWNPQKMNNENYSILMLKFTNSLGDLATKKVDYKVIIKNGTKTEFQENGTTFNGADLKLIGRSTFPKSSISSKPDMQINVTTFNDSDINEHAPFLMVPFISDKAL